MSLLHLRQLQDQSRGPRKAPLTSAVVFLHGYGADGADLLGLADPMAPHLPHAAFYAPDAPEPCAASPFGRQWFSIPRFDGTTMAVSMAGMMQSASDLAAYLASIRAATGLENHQIALVGFSQGTMMALEVGLRELAPLAAIVGFSGRLNRPEVLDEIGSYPPVLLLHGDRDEVVGFEELGIAATALTGAGLKVGTHVMAGHGHTISPDGLSAALALLAGVL